MYILYKKKEEGISHKFIAQKQISLFGCNVGIIPKLLKHTLPNAQSAPFRWHIQVQKMLGEIGYRGSAIVIDIKPYNTQEKYLTLCELVDVWGHTMPEWTPILMRMRGLFIDADLGEHDKSEFVPKSDNEDENIYTILYLRGSIENGNIIGRWTPSRASTTNSTLLWPDTLSYFIKCIGEATPSILAKCCAFPACTAA